MKILITGGSGFLGRALMYFAPWHDYTVYSRDERKQELCKSKYTKAKYVLGDVRDRDRLLYHFKGQDVVIHAAAIKYIPEAEKNVNECIDVNVQGSRNVLWAAQHVSPDIQVIGVSTDKAVQPVNVYGASKMLMERLFLEAHNSGLHANVVRYGNVVGSTGSVIPFFQQRIQQELDVPVTDYSMTRYWMSPSHAVTTVLSPIVERYPSGHIIVPELHGLDMLSLAEMLLARVNASTKNIHQIGIRPGEKKYESLIHEHESHKAAKVGDYWLIGQDTIHNETFSLRSDDTEMLTDTLLENMLGEAELIA